MSLTSALDEGLGVVFDGENVWFKEGMDQFRFALQDIYGLTAEQTSAQYLHSAQMRRYKCGGMSTEDFWKIVIPRWGINATQTELTDLLASCYKIDPVLKELVVELRARGVATGLCSNTSPDRIEGAERLLGFKRYFDVQVFSYDPEVRSTKPRPKIYEVLKRRMGGCRFLFADNKEANVIGAEACDIESVVYTTPEAFIKQFEQFAEIYSQRKA